MARGAWFKTVMSAKYVFGGQVDIDPLCLLGEAGDDGRLPYDPHVLQAIQDSGKAR